ncbi:MAG: hypothetical protein FAZ92_02277 [Accumulibacter sp.]|nr:MAG: hypothetical protein FAZ92_02277 [Accumulibacter sp.]
MCHPGAPGQPLRSGRADAEQQGLDLHTRPRQRLPVRDRRFRRRQPDPVGGRRQRCGRAQRPHRRAGAADRHPRLRQHQQRGRTRWCRGHGLRGAAAHRPGQCPAVRHRDAQPSGRHEYLCRWRFARHADFHARWQQAPGRQRGDAQHLRCPCVGAGCLPTHVWTSRAGSGGKCQHHRHGQPQRQCHGDVGRCGDHRDTDSHEHGHGLRAGVHRCQCCRHEGLRVAAGGQRDGRAGHPERVLRTDRRPRREGLQPAGKPHRSPERRHTQPDQRQRQGSLSTRCHGHLRTRWADIRGDGQRRRLPRRRWRSLERRLGRPECRATTERTARVEHRVVSWEPVHCRRAFVLDPRRQRHAGLRQWRDPRPGSHRCRHL